MTEEGTIIRSALRGKFKKELNLKKNKLYLLDPVAVGDEVEFDLNFDSTGVITSIRKRRNYLSRKAPKLRGASYRGERLEQIIVSNIDCLFVVASIENPKFNNRLIDRILVSAESGKIETKLVINKSDLDNDNLVEKWEKLYSALGYEVFVTSAEKNLGLNVLKEQFGGKTSCLWGQSGVGKSSLLNKLFPHLNLKVGDISLYSKKGRHTTVTVQMLQVEKETFLVDTPGIREIEPYGIKKEDLGHYFVEFTEYLQECKFNSCTHNHEPGCKVVKAVEKGEISKERYISYLNLLNTVESDINF